MVPPEIFGAHLIKKLVERSGVRTEEIDDVTEAEVTERCVSRRHDQEAALVAALRRIVIAGWINHGGVLAALADSCEARS